MLVTEEKDEFIHTYSDAGFYILQKSTNIEYSDAMDLKTHPQEYEETDRKIETSDPQESTETEEETE